MFNLLRHFSIASAIVVFVVTTALAVLHDRQENTELMETAEHTNTTLANALATMLRPRFFEYIGTITDPNGDAIRAHPTTREIDQAVHA